MATITLKPLKKRIMTFGIKGTTPLIMHQWGEKAKREMREKLLEGKKTKTREKRVPEDEAKAATYTTIDGDIGIPGMAFKKALITAAHKDIGIEKTLVRKALFLLTNDPNNVSPINSNKPTIREDMVRVNMGGADMRYRPEFTDWSCLITMEVDAELLQCNDVLTLVERAGFSVGICEWRPEKDGEYGRFEIDPDVPVTFEE